MPKLTVFLIRHGETIVEVEPEEEEEEEDEEEVDENGQPIKRKPPAIRLHQKLDPSLTMGGYLNSAVVLTRFVQALAAKTPDGEGQAPRKMAVFAAPFKSCTGTAMMMCCTGLQNEPKLRWRYTTVGAAKSPTAIPVIVVNELVNQSPEINRLGGTKDVVNAGLLHCAAAPFNDARTKCPMMKVVVQEYKEMASDPVKEWKNERGVNEIRRIVDVQYLRLDNNSTDGPTKGESPWNLVELTPKINLIVDMIEPNKYLTPPRRGGFEKKTGSNKRLQQLLSIGPDAAVKSSVLQARQVGCDTVLMFVPDTVITKIIDDCNNSNETATVNPDHIGAGTIATITATIDDVDNSIWFHYDGLYTSDDILEDADQVVPRKFYGPMDCTVPPPTPEQDPDNVPPNQWSIFPPPQPEVIPDDYPDLPPFSEALDEYEDDPEDTDDDDEDDEDEESD